MFCEIYIISTAAQRIHRILEAMFKFALSLMTQANSKFCQKIDSSRVMKIINRVSRWSYELKNVSFKYLKALRFSKTMI